MSYISTILADNPVCFVPCSDAVVSSGSSASELSGISTCTYGGTGWTANQAGIPGALTSNSAAVTAGNGQISVADIAGNQTVDTFTFELWIKMASLPTTVRGLIGSSTRLVRIDTGGTFKLTRQGVVDVCTGTVAIPADNSWHYVGIAKNGGTSTKLVLDGLDISGGVTNNTFATSSGQGYVLARNSNDLAPGATFAMFAIYQTALSVATMNAHYAAGTAVPVSNAGFFGLF